MKKLTLPLLLFAIAACSDLPSANTPSAAPAVPLSATFARSNDAAPIAGRYIVRFKDSESDVDGRAREIERTKDGIVGYTYRVAIKGVSVALTPTAAAQLRADPRVLSVEQDQTVFVSTTQAAATWGIDRLDQRNRPLSASYVYSADGSGVTAYIIDTGINFGHSEYTGRASSGIDAVTANGAAADCNGHGTHVAGTVGGTTYGVAKKVKLVAVRVLDCSGNGTVSGVIAGIDWVTAHRVLPAVANMSLGGGFSATLNQAVQNAVNAGVVFAVAAGNDSLDACTQSPSSAPAAIAVGATSSNDAFASFSNRGSCVAINAPGVGITSAWIGSSTASATISGTSMASPHVAGVAALYLQTNPGATPAQVRAALTSNATSNVISSLPANTADRLLYSGFIGGSSANAPPTARFTASCPTLQCTFDASTSTDDVGVVSYTWDWGNGRSETKTQPSTKNSWPVTGTYTVTLTVTDGGGLTSSISKQIIIPTAVVNQSPTATITAPSAGTSSVQGASVSFAGTGNDPEAGALTGAALAWTSSLDGTIGSGTSFSTTSLSVGTHVITLTATDPQNAVGTATRTITITAKPPQNQPPAAKFTFSCATGTSHQCTFDASTSTDDVGVVSYAWDWGNGRNETKTQPTSKNSWPTAGTFSVTLKVTDGGGLTSSITKSVVVP